jgi:pSer/pThr/pTyr-binding forkhead associated (FHA) protein
MKLIINGPSLSEEHLLNKNKISIGRDDSCDWPIKSSKLSKLHCEVIFHAEKNKYFIVDKSSKNGVMVDGERIEVNATKPINESSTILLAGEFILTMSSAEKSNQVDKLYSMKVKNSGDNKSLSKKKPANSLLRKILLTFLSIFILFVFWFSQK